MKNLYDVHNSDLLKNNNDISIILIKDLMRARFTNKTFQTQVIRILGSLECSDLLDVRTIVSAIVKEAKLQKPSPTVSIKKASRLQDFSISMEQEKRLEDREDEFHDIISEQKYSEGDDSFKNQKSHRNELFCSMIDTSQPRLDQDETPCFVENKTFRDIKIANFSSELQE